MSFIVTAIAEKNGKDPEAIRSEMQETLDLMWSHPITRIKIIRLSGRLTKPTIEEFIYLMAAKIVHEDQK